MVPEDDLLRNGSSLTTDVAYTRNLIRAGLDGITSARNEMKGDGFAPSWKDSAWAPVVEHAFFNGFTLLVLPFGGCVQ
jgi:hypothetical protein